MFSIKERYKWFKHLSLLIFMVFFRLTNLLKQNIKQKIIKKKGKQR